MKNTIQLAAFALAIVAAAGADASIIQVQTGYSNASAQSSAFDYRSVVDAAVATPGAGYGAVTLADSDRFLNQSTFGASNNVAFKSTVNFGVTGATSTWSFRAGVDFGNGGAVFLDGQPVALNTNNMWWGYGYGDSTQSFQFSSSIAAGNHTLQIYGLENCCDGGMQIQYDAGSGAGFQNFSASTLAPVPEPQPYMILMVGLGFVGLAARRGQARSTPTF